MVKYFTKEVFMGILIKKLILITLLVATSSLFANVAKVVALKGDASVVRNNTTIKLDGNSIIEKQDVITTKDNTKVQLLLKMKLLFLLVRILLFK